MAYDQEPLKTDLLAIRVLTCIDHDIVPHDLPDDQVYLLYIRWMLLAGNMSSAQYDASVDNVIAFLSDHGATQSHLATYLETWRTSARPNPMHVTSPSLAAAAE